MANPRAEIPIIVLSNETPTSPVTGATAVVKNRIGGTEATVFSDSGATNNTITQPLSSDSTGALTGWLPRGAYEIEITVPGKTPFTEHLDVAPAADGGVDSAWLAGEAVTGAKVASAIKDAAVGTASLRTLGTGATQAAAGNDSRFTNERVPTSSSVTEAKLADAAVTSRKFKPSTGVIAATSNLVLTESYQDVPGGKLEITPAVASKIMIVVFFDFFVALGSGQALGSISLDGGAENAKTANSEAFLPTWTSETGLRQTVGQVYELSLTAASHTIKMRAKRVVGTSSYAVNKEGSQMLYFLASS